VIANATTTDDAGARVGQMLYLYGFVLPDAPLPDGMTGVHDEPVRTEPLGDVVALVSDVADAEVIGLPAEVRAHAAVLDAVAKACAVLPVQFGTITANREALDSALPAERRHASADQLDRLGDVVQLSLTARYHEEAVIAELVAEDPQIRALRELTRSAPEAATYGSRMRLGELVVGGFDRKRATDVQKLEREVLPLVEDLRHREVSQVDAVLDVAVLVRRDSVARFEEQLEELAAALAGRITLRLVGPQAPYDFVEEV
jgi:hypothetical protein